MLALSAEEGGGKLGKKGGKEGEREEWKEYTKVCVCVCVQVGDRQMTGDGRTAKERKKGAKINFLPHPRRSM